MEGSRKMLQKEVIEIIEGFAPLDTQLSYDKCGLKTGDISKEATGVLVCLDLNENVIDEAIEPTSPSGPPRLMYTAAAFLVGLFIAIAIIVIADMANTRVRSAEEAAELTGLTIIGRIPVIK